jgi:enoyl-CoA hydratase/carnithine racemase
MADTLRLHRSHSLARITLNQPEKRNAISEAMWHVLPLVLADLTADPNVRLIVLEGAGGHFAAGADISEFAEVYATSERAALYSAAIETAVNALADCPKPTLARIEGACVGGGVSLALACDFRMAADNARFAITPGKLGLVYSLGDTTRLVSAIGETAARHLLFTGEVIDAAKALNLGLIPAITPAPEHEQAIAALLGRLEEVSPASIAATKTMLALATGKPSPAQTQIGRQTFLDAFASPDFAEGYRAFLEKRRPVFPSTRR